MSRKDFKEEDVVADHTKVLSKLWDTMMPSTYPYVLKFKTNMAKEVHTTHKIGPYSRSERFLDFDVNVIMDAKPLYDIGWNGEDEITTEMADNAYGFNYFSNMRGTMSKLMPYVGLKFSITSIDGNIDANVDNTNV
jgi:hypothetical protein